MSTANETLLSDAAANAAPLAENTLGESVSTVNVSAIDLFLGADIVVQVVMLILLMASIWSWTLIFAKSKQIRTLHKEADEFEQQLWSAQSLSTAFTKLKGRSKDTFSQLFILGMSEWQAKGASEYNRDRIQRLLSVTITKDMNDVEKHMTFLASVGSTAPFIGLFGTVWGIMNSFQGIAMSGSTNLAVVAPGIAEALFATALGLIAAIPAVLGYNRISSQINRYGSRLDAFADEFTTMLPSPSQKGAA